MKIPKSEISKVLIKRRDNKEYVITHNESKGVFTIYFKESEKQYKKLATSKSPLKLQEDVFSGKWDNTN